MFELATLTRLFVGTSSNQISKQIEDFNTETRLVNLKDVHGQDLKPLLLKVIKW